MTSVFVGRESDRAALLEWLDEALDGAPKVVLISGEAGAGKSRLLEEFLTAASRRGLPASLGRAVEQDGAPPFWPWRAVLSELGAPVLLTGSDTSDPGAERFRRFDAVMDRLIEHAEAHQGLIVALDDLHRCDVPSVQLFSHLAHALQDAPVMLLATHRRNRLDQAGHVSTLLADVACLPARRSLDLTGLEPKAVAELLGPGAGPSLVNRVCELTDGNALYVTELAHHLSRGRDLLDLPGSLHDVIGARVAMRSAACIDTLRAAAVVGRDFSAGIVATTLGRPAAEVLAQIDEAMASGLVKPGNSPGSFRFVHVIVRDVVEAQIPQPALARTHRDVAESIATYAGTGEDQLSRIARHWEAAAALGEEETAAGWTERAAAAANRLLAWEEAARLYERAVALTSQRIDPVVLHRRLMGAATARLHSDEIPVAIGLCVRAADAARRASRPDLSADAALLAEGRGGSAGAEVPALIAVAEDAVAALADTEHTLRARLLGLLTALYFYVDPTRCASLSAAAQRAADAARSPLATVAAARARQMVRFGAEHAAERLALADVMNDAGRSLSDPAIEQWASLWRIDALLELGRVPEAVRILPTLRLQTEAIGQPMSRWHLARSEAVLASATGRWADARRFGALAREIHTRQEGLGPALSLDLALHVSIGLHTGYSAEVLADYEQLDLTQAPRYVSDIPTIIPMLPLIALGRADEAGQLYDRLSPVDRWHPPPFLWLPIHTLRLLAAIELGRTEDVPGLLERLEPARGFHVAGGGGPIGYYGCVELQLGQGFLALGRWEKAATDLRYAVVVAKNMATPALEIRAAVLLAEALAGRAGNGDDHEVAVILSDYRPRAKGYQMRPWLDRLDALAARAGPHHHGPLSPREREVAALVADGMTNRAIAAALYITERTAQNHVQNILVKLGVSNRTQIAAWYREREVEIRGLP